MSGAHATQAPRVRVPAQPPRFAGALRVTGSLTRQATLHHTADRPPHLLLSLELRPQQGLPYVARVDLGTNVADHLAAEALLPRLRRGAVLSVAAESLDLRNDHSTQVLRLVQPHSVLLLEHPKEPEQQHDNEAAATAEPDLFATPTQPQEG